MAFVLIFVGGAFAIATLVMSEEWSLDPINVPLIGLGVFVVGVCNVPCLALAYRLGGSPQRTAIKVGFLSSFGVIVFGLITITVGTLIVLTFTVLAPVGLVTALVLSYSFYKRGWPEGMCPTCGYDLTGLDDGAVCPECGSERQSSS